MNVKYTTLITSLITCNIAHPAAMELKESKAKVAVSAESNSGPKQQIGILKQEKMAREDESLLPVILPPELHDIIKDYYFDEGDVKDVFLSVLYRSVAKLSEGQTLHDANFINNGKMVITREWSDTFTDSKLKLWDISDKEAKEIQSLPSTYYGMNISLDGNTIVAHNVERRTIDTFDTTGTCLDTIKIDDKVSHKTATTNQAHIIAHTTLGYDIKIWDTATKTCTTIPHAHNDLIWELIITNDNIIISASWDATIKLWDSRGTPIATLQGHTDKINTLTISPDHTLIATGSNDKTTKLWDIKTQQCILTISHTYPVRQIHLFQSKIMTASKDNGTLQVWDQKTGAYIATITDRIPRTNILAISPDGNTFISGPSHYWGELCLHSYIHKFDQNVLQILYKLSFANLIKLKQLIAELEKTEASSLPFALPLSKEQRTFLFSLPPCLQKNICHRFWLETQQEFETRTSEDRKISI